ncbi:transporter, cation channel family protein [Ancylostoma duodenale]|uniref:Transporter, cation channel family protein n=1 Tax=Ancylostoma duodenale TaxID=51022 RepID=A0A0C2DDF2_9BILA|nr:transporter, cation channel family protein [Ancylostoma duodenale]
MWQKKDVTLDEEFRQKLEKNEDGWRLVRLDADVNLGGTKHRLQKFLRSMAFQCFVIVFVLLNAVINASFVYRHDNSDKIRKRYYYFIEVGFTVLFNLECLIKILCYGFRNFLRRGIFKFEMILCIGSSLNAIKYFYDRNYFTYFQAFRLLRLIKASPILEDFVWKIFSPGKKLGGLVIFTITFVIIASAISLQLFYAIPNLPYFHTFPQAFMSMFQIITQEGWTDFVVEVLRATDDKLVPFVAIYFVAYHLFVTLIVLSLFVAVILDNLEMDEELKKVKQLRAREATTSMRSTLPWRLRVFEKFPTRPQMAAMRRVDSEFPMPKVRDSFAHQFALEGVDSEMYDQEGDCTKTVLQLAASRRFCQEEPHFRHVGSVSLKTSIANLLE